jgi:hypothetical protein
MIDILKVFTKYLLSSVLETLIAKCMLPIFLKLGNKSFIYLYNILEKSLIVIAFSTVVSALVETLHVLEHW